MCDVYTAAGTGDAVIVHKGATKQKDKIPPKISPRPKWGGPSNTVIDALQNKTLTADLPTDAQRRPHPLKRGMLASEEGEWKCFWF